MASKNQEKAVLVSHPVLTEAADGHTGVYRYAIAGSAQSALLPAGCQGKFLNIRVHGIGTAKVQYGLISGNAVSIVNDQTAAFASPDDTVGATLLEGDSRDGRIPQNLATPRVCWKGSAAGGFIDFYVSECAN